MMNTEPLSIDELSGTAQVFDASRYSRSSERDRLFDRVRDVNSAYQRALARIERLEGALDEQRDVLVDWEDL